MARPKLKIDIAELEKLCQLQCTDKEAAAFLGISVKTLERRKKIPKFAEAMDEAKAKGRVSVRRMLFTLGAKGNVAAAIFLAKNVLGYRDVLRNEQTGADGGPIAIENKLDISAFTDDELNLLETLQKKAQRDLGN